MLLTKIKEDDEGGFKFICEKLKLDINLDINHKSLYQYAQRHEAFFIQDYLSERGVKKPENRCRLFCFSKKNNKKEETTKKTICIIS